MLCLQVSVKDYETLRVTRVGEHVLHVELNRPKKLNAMNNVFWREMRECFELIKTDNNARAVVVSGGESRGFSDGADHARSSLNFLEMVNAWQESFSSMEKCKKPVIAAIHGVCIGGAIDLITACDIRYCAEDSIFSVREVDIAIAADIGTLQRLPKVVGNQSWVRELAFTGRDFGAKEAMQHGLVSKVLPNKEAVLAEALKLAELIASKSPIAVLGTKHILNHSRDHPVADSLNYVALWNASMLVTEDLPKAVQAALSKDKPKFAKL
ncbi:putative enoyl CoA hydratase [Blyttiomyces sp. JEL0837]|nr:putative enoyl CoA hydratase [Blyttiomyces sp. JEL0837]